MIFLSSNNGMPHVLSNVNDPKFTNLLSHRYDAIQQKLTIEAMPSPLHEFVVAFCQDSFNSLKLKLSQDSSLPAGFGSRISMTTGQTFTDFVGKWEGSEAVPDLGISWRTRPTNQKEQKFLRFVVEIGSSQSLSSCKMLRRCG